MADSPAPSPRRDERRNHHADNPDTIGDGTFNAVKDDRAGHLVTAWGGTGIGGGRFIVRSSERKRIHSGMDWSVIADVLRLRLPSPPTFRR
jgi:hypothetical protein